MGPCFGGAHLFVCSGFGSRFNQVIDTGPATQRLEFLPVTERPYAHP